MPGEFPSNFRANPKQVLGDKQLNISLNTTGVTTTDDGNVTVEFTSGKTIPLPLLGQVGQIAKMGYSQDAMGNKNCNMTRDYTTEDTYVLQWANDKIYYTKLGGGANYFATARLNGCGVIIGGDRTSPTVVHANISPDSVYPENDSAYKAWVKAEDKKEHQTQLSAQEKLDAWRRYYGNLAMKLRADGRISADNLIVLDPATYQADGPFARVFGVRADNGDWTLYVNRDKGSAGITEQIWPAP